MGVGRHDHEFAAVHLDKGAILREIGRDDHDLSVLYCECADGGDECRSRAAGKEDVFGADLSAGAAGEVVGNGLSRLKVTGSGRVAVDGNGVLRKHQPVEGLRHRIRRGDGGVADGKVHHVLFPDDFCLLKAVFEQFADAGALGAQRIHGIGNH